MKKIILLSLLLLLTIPFQRVFSQTDSVQAGFILADLFNQRWLKDRDYFKEKFNELGGKVTFIDCYDMEDNQVDAAKKFVAMKVNCIVIVAVNAHTAKSIVDIAKAAHIPVIAYDRLILNADLDLYTTTNSITVGKMMAQQVVDKLPKGNILYVGGPSDDFNSKLVSRGVFSVLDTCQDKYKVDSVQANTWNELDSYMIIQDFISKAGYVPDAIICAADALTYGAIDILKENGNYGKVLLTGQDAEIPICKQVIQGNVLMTVYKSNKALAYASAEAAMKLIKGEKIDVNNHINNGLKDVPSVTIPPVLITKATIDKELVDKGIYRRDTLYGK